MFYLHFVLLFWYNKLYFEFLFDDYYTNYTLHCISCDLKLKRALQKVYEKWNKNMFISVQKFERFAVFS